MRIVSFRLCVRVSPIPEKFSVLELKTDNARFEYTNRTFGLNGFNRFDTDDSIREFVRGLFGRCFSLLKKKIS